MNQTEYAIVCAVILVIIFFVARRSNITASDGFYPSYMKMPYGIAMQEKSIFAPEGFRDRTPCAGVCERFPAGQRCLSCLNRRGSGANRDLRGAVIGLLE